MNRIFILILLLLPWFSPVAGQRASGLQDSLAALCRQVEGKAGVYVKDLSTGKEYGYNQDLVFPTASMVKIPIMVAVMDQVQRGSLDYHQELEYRDSLLYPGTDILGSFKDGATVTLDKVMMLMLTMSDNTASLWLQHLAGSGTHINVLMQEYGLEHTRMNSRTPGRRGDWEKYGWGQTTPGEMAGLLEMIWKGEVISREASERMLRNLKRNFWDSEALIVLPPDVNTYSKNGAVDASRSEVVLVNGRSADYVFCVMTSDLQDTSWEYDNEGWEFIRNVSALLYRTFEPQDERESVLKDYSGFR